MENRPAAIEANHEGFLLAMGRVGGGEERDELRIQWVIGGSPVADHNAVVRADLSSEEVDAEIEASIEAMPRHGVGGSWHVGPSMRPSDLPGRLGARGFEEDAEPGMAAVLSSLPDPPPEPDTLTIDRVRTEEELDASGYVRALGQGFRMGFGDETGWRHLVGPARGRAGGHGHAVPHRRTPPGSLRVHVPAHRPRGIGAGITHAHPRGA